MTRPFALAMAAAAIGLLCSFLTTHSLPALAGAGDELPDIRRVLLRPEQLPAEMERVRRGTLRQLPQAEFDDLLGRATSAGASLRDPPRLVEARYRAALADESLAGSATWKLVHLSATPGLLTVEPFNLALRKAAWDDGTSALVGDFDSRHLTQCLVGRPGEQSLILDWSARGVPEPAGLRFDLRLPPCPVSILELDLPADREPVVPHDGGLLTGPTPGNAADRRLWRLAFANASQIELTVRPINGSRPPLVLARQRTRQEVTPGKTACEFAFDLEAPHGGVRELTLHCDPSLRPTDVTVRNLKRWEVRTGTAENELTQIHIWLREPLEDGVVTLHAAAPATPNRPWASPGAVVAGAITRGETLALRVHPDLRLTDWRAGAFRLTESAVAADRWQTLTLQSGLIRTGPGRPSARLRPAGVDYQVREQLWWSADADRMRLTAQLTFDVARGPVFQVPLRLPDGWDFERLDADPPDLLAATSPSVTRSELFVELQRPLSPGTNASLTFHLSRRPRAGDAIPLPDVLPTAASGRDGTLAVRVGTGLQASIIDGPLPDPKAAADRAAPWGDAPADYVFPLGQLLLEGTLQLSPRPARYRASVVTIVHVVGRQAALDWRLRLEPEKGGADAVLVHVSGTQDPWDWQVVRGTNRVRSVQRLNVPAPLLGAALAARSPWDVLTATAATGGERGTWWRIALARPLMEPVELAAHTTATLPVVEAWAVPLVCCPGPHVDDGQVTVDLRSAPGWQVQSEGLADLSVGGSRRQRTFRYSDGAAKLALIHSPNRGPINLDRARLITYATDPDRLVHRLSFRLTNLDASTVPLDLTAEAVVTQVRVNGAIARPLERLEDRLHLDVPAATDRRTMDVEVVYFTTGPGAAPLPSIHDEPPQLPNSTAILRRVWCLPSGVEPLQLHPWRPVPAVDRSAEGLMPAELATGTYWQPADGSVGDSIRLVRTGDVGLIGGFVAVVGLAVAWAGRSWPARRQWFGLLVWLAFAATAVIWLPQPLAAAARWPFLAAIVAVSWKLLPARTRSEAPTVVAPKSSASRVLTAGVFLACWLDAGGRAAGPAPTLIYLVPGPAEAPQRRTVLAPPDLLDRLRASARRGPVGLDGTVWLDARYDGRVVAGSARFTATLRFHSFADDPPAPVLPLTGVQLREAKLDGAPAFLRANGDRYLVPVHGRGPHTLELEFAVPIASTEEERELRFGIPEILNSHLTLVAPAAAKRLQTLSWRGEQHVDTDGAEPRLDVDLGRVGNVQVRWRMEAATPRPATVRTQEAFLWELTESAARLFGAIRFMVGPGSATTLAVALPKDLEVVAVTARSGAAAPAGTVTGWLREWHVAPPAAAGGRRSLVLEFAAPISGSWQVNLELAPREPFAASFALPFPSAVGARSAPPVFAWRAEGVDLTDTPPAATTPLAPESFLRDHWLPAKAEADPRPPTKAYQRNAPGQALALRLRAATGVRDQATAEIAWNIGRQRAEVEATAHVTVPGGQVSLVEWTVPVAVNVVEVQGADIHAWSRTGNRLQVWLSKPVAESTVRITGFVKRSTDSTQFELPPLRPRADLGGGILRVKAGQGIALSPLQSLHLTESAPAVTDGGERSFAIAPAPASAAPYKATFEVRTVATPKKLAHSEQKPRAVAVRANAVIPPRQRDQADQVEAGPSSSAMDIDRSESEESSSGSGQLLRTVVVLVVGLLGVGIARRFGATAWPEQMVFLGVVAFAATGEPLWSLPTAFGVVARIAMIVRRAPSAIRAGTESDGS